MSESIKDKQIPVLVRILSVMYYIGSVTCLINAIAVIINADIKILGLVVSILSLGLAIFFFFIGKGLWKGKSWSRLAVIIITIIDIIITIVLIIVLSNLNQQVIQSQDLSSLGDVVNVLEIFDFNKFLPKAIGVILINLLIAGYLLLNKKVKEVFERR